MVEVICLNKDTIVQVLVEWLMEPVSSDYSLINYNSVRYMENSGQRAGLRFAGILVSPYNIQLVIEIQK